MQKLVSLASAVAVVCLAAALVAQGKPNFAGKWTQFEPDPAAAMGGGGGGGRGRGMMGGGWGSSPVVTQDASTLTVEFTAGGPNAAPQKHVFKLDGSESKNTVTTGRGGPQDQISKAVWDGSKLAITTTISFTNPQTGDAMKFEIKRSLSLDASGNLVVETTSSGMRGGQPTTSTVKYKKG
jgi:hypothetical protein